MKNIEIEEMLDKLKSFDPLEKFDEKWISSSINEKTIDYTKNLGFFLCQYFRDDKGNIKMGKGALSNSQIRNVFGEVKRIQMKLKGSTNKQEIWNSIKPSFLLLQPKLAYAAGRAAQKQRKSVLPKLKDVLTIAIKAVEADKLNAYERYENFVDFLESVLAFHKVYGGKEN